MFSFLKKRSIFGFTETGKRWPYPLDLSCLLTKYKNYSNDEYSTLDDSGMSVPPMACRFAKGVSNGHILSVVDEDGYVVLYNINKSGQEAVVKTWQVHSNAVFDMEWLLDDRQILTASGDQTLALWDVETMTKMDCFRGHSSSVRSVALRMDDDAVFASGSRDGHIMIWDKRVIHKDGVITPVNAIYNAHALQQSNTPGKARKKKQHMLQPKDGQQSVTAVLFQDENYLVSAGSVDGCIKIWDTRKTYKMFSSGATPVHILNYPGTSSRKHGYSSLTFDHSKCRLFASCTDDTVYEYNLMSFEDKPVHSFRGHKNSSFYVKTVVSPDNQFLLSGSSDHHAYIWQVNKPEMPPVILKAHDAEVTGVEWCHRDFTKLVTLSDDAKTKFWRIYCRELKSNLHPQWFGRARRFSRDRATSTVETTGNTLKDKPSSSSVNSSPHGKLKTPTLEATKAASPLSVSKSPSLREWLKRKTSVDLVGISEPSSSKILCQTPEKKASADDCLSPVARPENVKYKKRSLDVSRTSDECNINNIPSKTCSTNVGLKDQIEESPKKRAKTDGSLSISEPVSKSCFSPVKPDRTLVNNHENIHHPSPQKLKHKLNLEGSFVSSPKRPCLTNLDTNGAFHRPSSVRQSLFGSEGPVDMESMKCMEKEVCVKDVKCDVSSGLPKPTMYPELRANSETNTSEFSPNCKVSNNQRSTKSTLRSPEDLNSPTHNLPNLVKDQLLNLQPTSPNLVTSPHAKRVDWLTQLRLSKNKSLRTEEVNNIKRQSPSPARSSPKAAQNVKMKNIQAYFIGQSGTEKS